MIRSLATLVAVVLGSLARAQELVPDQAIEIELTTDDPLLEGHGPSRAFEYDVAFDGTLYVWATSKDFDPILRITSAGGALLAEDDDSGGGTTAFVALTVACNGRSTLAVASKSSEAFGTFVLHLSATPTAEDSDLTQERALLDGADVALAALDYATAREKASLALDALLARADEERDAAWLELLKRPARSAWNAQDARTANRAWAVVLDEQARRLPEDHPDLQAARNNLAGTMYALGDLPGARALQEQVLAVYSRTLPENHPNLQRARHNLAGTMRVLGDLAGARALQEQVLTVYSRTLPADHPDLQAARHNLAGTMHALNDFAGARALFEQVLAVYSSTLPEEHRDLLMVRLCLATTMSSLGDFTGARALFEQVLAVYSRTLPEDHSDLQTARANLAATMSSLGDFAGARGLFEQVLAVRSRTLPADHPDLQMARANLAVMIQDQGDLAGARALFEQVLAVYSRTLPADHPLVQRTRQGLACTIEALGDLAGARALFEQVLAVYSQTLPDDHLDLQRARYNLAGTMYRLGDLPGARALHEQVLAVCSRTLAEDHLDLQNARQGLASTVHALGDFAEARVLFAHVLAVYSRTLPEDHPVVQVARLNLAITLHSLGEFAGARALGEQVLAVRSRTLPADHADLQRARQNLAITMHSLGDSAGARTLFEQVLAVYSRTLPEDHPDLQKARGNVAVTIAALSTGIVGAEGQRERDDGRKRCVELVLAQCRSQTVAARAALLEGSPREAEARCTSLTHTLDQAISFADGYGVFHPSPELQRPCFELSETTRGAALGSAALTRLAANSPRYGKLKSELEEQGDELARIAQRGTTSQEFHEARARRESIERELVALAKELSGGSPLGLDLDIDALAAKLAGPDALVAYRRYEHSRLTVAEGEQASPTAQQVYSSEDSLCAFVLRRRYGAGDSRSSQGSLTRVELGPIEPIEQAVRAWREAIGVVAGRGLGVADSPGIETLLENGEALRRLVLDPIASELAGATRVVVVLDDVLHLVPFDALPQSGSSGELLGDRLQIETRATLTELMSVLPQATGRGTLVAVGGVSFDELVAQDDSAEFSSSASLADAASLPSVRESLDASGPSVPRRDLPGILRGGSFGGFQPLPATAAEVESLAESFAEHTESQAEVSVLRGADATRERLLELAPRARWLHVATHGWFASESIRSWSDPEPIDVKSGLVFRQSGEEQVKGMSPMLLCGLALAGANLPENEVGRAPGLITAEEIAALDLTRCELAVLSACDTNLGERRAGQGVASLQRALQMAGARSVITSLWKVPDEATRELMTEFYRRIWVEKKPKWQALWEAKQKLREAKDESGEPKYTTRDWAAWVLTGEQD